MMRHCLDDLFLELLRVSLGTQDALSRIPSMEEWRGLYDLSVRQSLAGICFAGISKLGMKPDDFGMSEDLYYDWMGLAYRIQERNGVMDEACAKLQDRLSADGFRSCILKGQGVALLYDDHLRGLRQSGDIDVWLWREGTLKERRNRVIRYASQLDPESKAVIHHVDCKFMEGVAIEFHYMPSWFYSPVFNHRFVKWCESQAEEQMSHRIGDITVPTVRFNSVYIPVHIYRHLIREGIGLRQLVDFYCVLSSPEALEIDRDEWNVAVGAFGMAGFMRAIMWVMQETFGLDRERLLCEPDAVAGAVLLKDVMNGGNFGLYGSKSPVLRDIGLLLSYPAEFGWAPLWKVWHWCWRKFYL